MSQCTVSCDGFSALRDECVIDPCLGVNMCPLAGAPQGTDCAAWCCETRGGVVFFLIVTFALGCFALCSAYYLNKLHQHNVKAGAVGADGLPPAAPVENGPKRRRRRTPQPPQLREAGGAAM